MAERQIIQHLRTNELNVKPDSSNIEYGEIAINYKKNGEKLFIKNDSDEIIEFRDKTYIDNLNNSKQDKISDLETIRNNAAKGATALQVIPSEYITETELQNKGYITSIPSEYITATQLQNKGYLTSIPSEYVTETELQNKGFLTAVPSEYITETELQNKGYLTGVPSEYVTESELQGKGYLTSHQDISHLATKAELTGYTTDSEFTALSNTVSQKANTSALNGYSTTGHNHDDRYYTEGEVDNKVNTLSNRITTVENYTVPDARNKVLYDPR